MPRKRILEVAGPEERAKQRRKLGTLRELTVQPLTRKRYDAATSRFFQFLKEEQQELPRQRAKVDELICDYLEHLWSSGAGRGLACDTLAGLQDLQPNLRNHLPGPWRLLKAWHVNEVPNRAPPLPEHVVWAIAGWDFFKGHASFAVSILAGFYTMLRTGELLGLRSSALMAAKGQSQVLISLGMTKGGKRHGAAESVVLGVTTAVGFVKRWKHLASPTQSLTPSPAAWRKLFNDAIEALGISQYGFRPYSLRRGGATWWFSKHQSLDRILVQGRWHAHKSARIYIDEGLSMLASMRIPPTARNLHPYIQGFHQTAHKCNFSTLEPPPAGADGRSGGRGKAAQKSRKRQKSAFLSTDGQKNHPSNFWRPAARRFGSVLLCVEMTWPYYLGFGRVWRA